MLAFVRRARAVSVDGRSSFLAVLVIVFAVQALGAVSIVGSVSAQDKASDAGAREPREVTAVVPRSWPPQYQVDEDGKPFGFAIDVMNEIAALANLTVTYRIADNFSAAVDILRSGGADLIPNSGILSERLEEFAFTAPVETFAVSIFARSDDDQIDGVADLIGRNLAVVEKNIGLFMFGKRRDIKVHVFRDVRTALFELVAGQVDALVYPRPVLLTLARRIGVEDRIKVVGRPLREVKRGIRVMRRNERLLTVLNKAVVEFVGTPAYHEIYLKWFSRPVRFWTVARISWVIGAIVVVLFVAMAIWRYRSVVRLNRNLRTTFEGRERAEAAMRESEGRLRSVMDNAADAIITIGEHGLIESFNHAASLMFGYPSEETLGKNVSILMAEPYRSKHDGYIGNYVRTGKARIIGIGLRELTAVNKDGTEFPIELSVAESRSDGKHFFIGSIRDITQRKQEQEQLQQAQKMEAIGQLTGGVAHDFNNMLTTIVGNLELLRDRVADDEDAKKFTDAALRAGFRGADLTQRLLVFSRKQPLDPKPTDINKCVVGATELMRRTLGEDIEIETVLGGGLWNAMIDEIQLESALLNLAINSRDAMPNGGKLTIETVNSHLDQEYVNHRIEVTPGQYVMVTISDTGSGMAADVLDRVFEPFFTTKEVGKGTGLGLSMVYGFVKQSGGHVAVYSEPGEGTSVKLYLPRAKSREADEHVATAAQRTAMPTGDETILVVEDDPDVRSFVASALGILGYQILEAEDGPSALALVTESRGIDLLFTDVVLPGGMNGRELADEIRRRKPDIKILFTSGYTENAIVHHGRLDAGTRLLAKPYKRETLAVRIRNTLDE